MTVKSVIRKSLARFIPSFDPESYVQRFANKSDAEIFKEIYRKNIWGGRLTRGAYSGSGSRNRRVVDPYVSALRGFLLKVGRPSVVDLGCGDFHVGKQFLDYSKSYVACDIVDFVIEENRRRYPGVDFIVVDATKDKLPSGEVILIRQVFQHLSNEQISKILPKLAEFKYAVVTEHIPAFREFLPNLDKRTGPDHRVSMGSGIELTSPPFNLKATSLSVLCEVVEFGGIIRTTVYTQPTCFLQ